MEGGSGGTDSNDPSRRQSEAGLNESDIKSESTKMAATDTGQNKLGSTTASGVNESPEPMEIDVDGNNGTPKAVGKLNSSGDTSQNQAVEVPLDPVLAKQGLPESVLKGEENEIPNTEPMDSGGSETTAGSTAQTLITLAGGALQYVSAQQQSQSGTNGVGSSVVWAHHPSSPESPNRTFNGLSPPLPSMRGQNSSPTNRDGKHTTLPPINSIDVLAEIATKEGSPQKANWLGPHRTTDSRTGFSQIQAPPNRLSTPQGTTQSPPGLPPPTPNSVSSAEGTPRPALQHLSVQQRQRYMALDGHGPEYSYPHHQPHYPPIKDAANSPQPAYPTQPVTPDSANLFARGGFPQTSLPPSLEGRRGSTSSEFQYNSDQTTPRGPSTGETLAGSGPEEVAPSPPAPPPPPRNQRAQTGPLAAGGFKCEYPDCKAPPFQTQYLLNSHANVHSSARPHYCPIKGCPRGEGGKGFKRKNEMIRHGLVHDSPGYVCPFCPDREHKYPRPDNLQRHVRVHHMDKDKDDPQLRDVLSQRPEGGSRGRRRRHGG